HHPPREDYLAQPWFQKKAAAVQHQQANAHALIGSCDLSDLGGFKRFSSFANSGAFVNSLERLRAAGETPNHYECIDANTPSKFYVEIDYTVGERDDEDFGERFQHCKIVLRGFLELVLLVPAESIAFQVATAHGGDAKAGLSTLAHFLEKPPEALRRSCEFLFYEGNKGAVIVEGCLVDTAVYSCFQNWRTLHSEKKGSGRPLAPPVGSSRDINDHLVGFYGAADVAAAIRIDSSLLAGYNQREEPAASISRRPVDAPTRGLRGKFVERGRTQRPLTGVEKERLLWRYRKDHPEVCILRVEAMGEDLFTVHFGVPTSYCWIAGQAPLVSRERMWLPSL
ncbi:hypothetical protein KFL_013130010, partial [Klebsormidium nitens]